ncbi:MAG: phosphoglycerate kinase, partial [Bacteroidetes bacterium]|nr:phosphoglycerate kinase [Bacteroidota bacterium]
IIGGGMTYTFVKAMGGSIGNSLVETDYIDTAKKVMEKAKEAGVKLLLPIDSVNGDAFDNDAKRETSSIDAVPENWLGMDIGDKTIELFCNTILNSSTILWNGPMGVFEMSNFQKGTFEIAQAITESTQNGAFSLVGGGDSVAAVNKFNMADKVSYVSTGGGALLEYIEGKELPGIKAIREK